MEEGNKDYYQHFCVLSDEICSIAHTRFRKKSAQMTVHALLGVSTLKVWLPNLGSSCKKNF